MKTVVKSLLAIGLLATTSTALWVYNTRTPSGICVSEGRVLTDEEIVRRYLQSQVDSGRIGFIKEKDHRLYFNPIELEQAYPNSIFAPFTSVDDYLALVPDCCILANEGEEPRVMNFDVASGYFIPEGSEGAYFERPPPKQFKTLDMNNIARVGITFSYAIKRKKIGQEWEPIFRSTKQYGNKFVDRSRPEPRYMAPSWVDNCGEGTVVADGYF